MHLAVHQGMCLRFCVNGSSRGQVIEPLELILHGIVERELHKNKVGIIRNEIEHTGADICRRNLRTAWNAVGSQNPQDRHLGVSQLLHDHDKLAVV